MAVILLEYVQQQNLQIFNYVKILMWNQLLKQNYQRGRTYHHIQVKMEFADEWYQQSEIILNLVKHGLIW